MADCGRATRLARLYRVGEGPVRRTRPATAARRRDAARLLRDSGRTRRGARTLDADERACRAHAVLPQPPLARDSPARGTRLGGAGGVPDRPARAGRLLDRPRLPHAGGGRARARERRTTVSDRRADPGTGRADRG